MAPICLAVRNTLPPGAGPHCHQHQRKVLGIFLTAWVVGMHPVWGLHLNHHGQCLHLGYRRWVGRYGEPVAESCQSPRPKQYLPSLPLTFLIEYSSTSPYLTLSDAFIIKQFVRLGLCEPRHGPNGFASIHSSVCSRRAYILILGHCRSSAVLGHRLARPSIPYHPPQGTVSMPIGAPLE